MATKYDQETADCAAMVAERNLPGDFVDSACGPSIAKALQQLTHVKLDRESITALDTCRFVLSLPKVTNLYLQQNGLKSLKGIEFARELKFLMIADNELTELCGLSSLSKLMVLDASENLISRINADTDLPQSLSFLNVDGNPCSTEQEGLREHLKTALPNLKELDGDLLTDYSCSDNSTDSENNYEEEGDQEEKPNEEPRDQVNHVGETELHRHEQAYLGDASRAVTPSAKGSRTSSRVGTPAGRGRALALSQSLDVVERLGTPSSVKRAIGTTPIPTPDKALEGAAESQLIEFYQMKESLFENNIDAEGALQTVLSHTVGQLDHQRDMIIERSYERMKNLDVQLGEEIVQLFFSPETSPRSQSPSQDEASSSAVPSSVMSPTSIDHWKYVGNISSDLCSKGSSSVQNTDSAGQSSQGSPFSERINEKI